MNGAFSPEAGQRWLAALFEGIGDPLLVIDEALTIRAANGAAATHAKLKHEELVGQPCYRVLRRMEARCEGCAATCALATGRPSSANLVPERQTGLRDRTFICWSYPVAAPPGAPREVIVHVQDVTEPPRVQEERPTPMTQHRLAEALRTIGGLAIGAAHDFASLLTIIGSSAHFLLETLNPTDPRRREAERIEATADRGRRLVHTLIAFRDLAAMSPERLDLALLVTELAPMLRGLLGDQVHLRVLVTPRPWNVYADREQIERVILNLVDNAGDAVRASGRGHCGDVTVEVANIRIDSRASMPLARDRPPPGEYVMVAVTDTGCGIAADIRDRIFEPFFTTKSPGQGAGIGLAGVVWILRLQKGYIVCETEPGQGATFRVYLPRHSLE